MSNLFYASLYIITLIIIIIILYKNKPTTIDETYKSAEEMTRFKPTYFLIFDKSKTDICDRLIIVQPFGWLIWAINKNVYILDNVTGHQCPLGSSAAIRVTQNIFTMNAECINIVPTALLNLYNDPIKIDYDITNSSTIDKFTVLDALNILFKEYITMALPTEEEINDMSITGINNKLRYTHLNPNYLYDNKNTVKKLTNYTTYNPKINAELFDRLYLKKINEI